MNLPVSATFTFYSIKATFTRCSLMATATACCITGSYCVVSILPIGDNTPPTFFL